MLNDIIVGISNKIEDISSATIYSETIPQGFDEPCFFIMASSVNQTKDIGGRYKLDYNMIVKYFPQSYDSPNEENADVLEQLYLNLEFITVNNDLVMGHDMNGETVDGVLFFYVRYPIRIARNKQVEDYMREVTVNAKSS